MRTKSHSFAIAFTALATAALPQSARAQSALGGTSWESDQSSAASECALTYGIKFNDDGTAKIFSDADTYLEGTWILKGTDLAIRYTDNHFASDRQDGAFTGGDFTLVHSWAKSDGSVDSESCTFTKM
jgi:exo-beta-1,3-glucanase (GH17 family)